MTYTIIELEDYFGNTLYRIDIEKELNEDEIKIKGFDFADQEDNILRFQKVEE